MKLKTLVVTVLVLAALSAGVYFGTRNTPPPSADARIDQPLIAGDLAEKAVKLKIADQGKSVVLARQADGTWTVPAYYDFPADFQKLSGFVNDLTAAKIVQLVTTSPQRLSRLEFKDTQVTFLDAADKPLLTLTLGKSADAGGKFVRFNDESRGYRTNLNAWLDADAKSWANPVLVTLKPEDVARVEVDLPSAPPVIATRTKKEDPFVTSNPPAGQELNSAKITALVTSLTGLRFNETTEPTDANAVAAKENQRRVKLTTFDGKTLQVALGRKPEQKVIKPPVAKPDGKTGPASLGSVSALTTGSSTGAANTKDEANIDDLTNAAVSDRPATAKGTVKGSVKGRGPAEALGAEVETIPAGPVFAFVTSSDEKAPINAMMRARAFQVYDYGYSSLPKTAADLFEPVAAPQTTVGTVSTGPASKPKASTDPSAKP